MFKFIDKHNLGKPYCYIHPYHQLNVKNLVEKTFDGIQSIIVFGSAVTPACHQDSDLDICVIGAFDEALLSSFRVKYVPMDCIHFNSIEDAKKDIYLCEEIKKGVVVYGYNHTSSKSGNRLCHGVECT